MISYSEINTGLSFQSFWSLVNPERRGFNFSSRKDGFQNLNSYGKFQYRIVNVSRFNTTLDLVKDFNLKSIKSGYSKVDFI